MKKARPFQSGRKVFHQVMSAIASELRRMWWWSCWTLVLRLIRRRRNRRTAGSARVAKLKRPISESSFRLVILRGADRRSNSARISRSLVCGRRISWRVECSSNPRKVRLVLGPSSLSRATGMPSKSQTRRKVSTLWAHRGEPGCSMIR